MIAPLPLAAFGFCFPWVLYDTDRLLEVVCLKVVFGREAERWGRLINGGNTICWLKPAPAGDTTANANFLRNSKSMIIGETYPNEAVAIPRPKHVLELRG